ncbi:MAG: glycosyltransferase, partial [bacterium]|nr:glycosyltransferase [bacterium]
MKNKVSIIIPVYNEVNSVKALIERILIAFKASGHSYEIIFIDDHSTDGTFAKIQKFTNKKIKLLRKVGKKGKSFSLFEGFKKATGDVIVMIDADLQYPPEAIPDMVNALKDADIVVANRKNYKDSYVRKFISNGFRMIFGKLLFGMNHDVQSGLKAMTREVIESIKFTPRSAWTFDLEFLHRAKQAGFKIKNCDINFARRENDISKIGFIKTSFEIGLNALIVRAKRIHPVAIPSHKPNSMLGAGVMHKQKKLITHTTLHHSQSALSTFIPWQIALIGLVILSAALGLFMNFKIAIIAIIAILSGIYFIDVLFSLYVILKSLYFPPELNFKTAEIKGLKDKSLPVYSILCPLFHEASVLPDFLNSIKKLDWPKDKLEVLLLLEKDDRETINAVDSLNLPSYVRTIIVPHSNPQTKPKACNYGLNKAIGEYLVIFDAEDRPEPDQLKKAYLGFQKVSPNVVCLQAKLNYFNPHQNLLTRLFTAEYSLWFDVVLTGLQSINTTIPLGGTSNHFRTAILKELEGWDPFNVTEDCDLGVRLFKKNYKTAIIDSTTWEEANSDVKNWLRQRSRWIKGYLQTYLVHNRHPLQFIKKHGIHAFIFQLIIGARMSFMLINPILWVLTISYFTLYSLVGPTIESFYPTQVFYMAVISLVLGNFMYVYNYMIGCAKRRQWNLIKFVYLIPFYWLLASASATIALYQLIVKPHYWEKTIHGLHLQKSKKKAVEILIETEEVRTGFAFPSSLRRRWEGILASKKAYFGGAFLVGAILLGNFGNFIFSAYLGRVLSFKDFALVGLAGGFLSFSSNIFGAFNAATNFRSSFLIGKYGENTGYGFWNYMVKKSILISIILTAFWFMATPLLMNFFNNSNALLFILFGVTILIGF